MPKDRWIFEVNNGIRIIVASLWLFVGPNHCPEPLLLLFRRKKFDVCWCCWSWWKSVQGTRTEGPWDVYSQDVFEVPETWVSRRKQVYEHRGIRARSSKAVTMTRNSIEDPYLDPHNTGWVQASRLLHNGPIAL